MSQQFWTTSEHNRLLHLAADEHTSISSLIKDAGRNKMLEACFESIVIDATRSRIDQEAMEALHSLWKKMNVDEQLEAMVTGGRINKTENRAVGHVALRGMNFEVDGKPFTQEVQSVLTRIRKLSSMFRNGEILGYTGQVLKNILCIGIGGSYLGLEFLVEALRAHPEVQKTGVIRLLANVDPLDVERAMEDLNLEETLVVVISKTFTTAETMLNATTVKARYLDRFGNNIACIASHFCAVSTAVPLCEKFGLRSDYVFGFWDWVGGRFSVTSAVGILPLALQYGYNTAEQILAGAHSVDLHVVQEKSKSLPALLAMAAMWHTTYCGYPASALLPYSQGLSRFPAHIQQVSMESNGKGVTADGVRVPVDCGEIIFGEPGTNGQHSFYQLIHQGRIVPAEFIGFARSQTPISMASHTVTNHDELMCNFFSQPDALVQGQSADELTKAGVDPRLIPHKVFSGNRPSISILFLDQLNAYTAGQLLALYEHKIAIQGFLWGINSFDQWGVELGKILAVKVRAAIAAGNTNGFPANTQALMELYLKAR